MGGIGQVLKSSRRVASHGTLQSLAAYWYARTYLETLST
jgi:hypothetical protein